MVQVWFAGVKFQLVQSRQISLYNYMGKSDNFKKFYPSMTGQFFTWHLFSFVYIFYVSFYVKLLFHPA